LLVKREQDVKRRTVDAVLMMVRKVKEEINNKLLDGS